MNKMKRIISMLFLSIFIFTNISSSVFSNNEENKSKLTKQLIVSKYNLSKTYTGKKYMVQFDRIIENFEKKWDLDKINSINSKVWNAISKLESKNTLTKNEEEYLNLFKYLESKIELSLINIEIDNWLNNNEEKDNNINVSNLNETEKKKVENEIVKLQLNLFDKTTKNLEVLFDEFEKLTNYEDNGNLKMNMNFDYDSIWKIDYNFNFSDYSIKASNFDSQLKWKIEAVMNASMKWEEEFKIELSWFVDFISKDWNIYLLLEKFNIIDENEISELKEIVKKIKEISETNKYISYTDENSKEAMQILNSLTPAKIISEGKSILSKPMFEAYGKVDNKFLLKPTKYACDKMKELSNKFDPFNWTSCTDSQYKKLIKDLNETWIIYMIIWDNNEIWFISDQDWVKINSKIVYNEKNILEVIANITPDQNKYKNEWLNLSFKNNESLNINTNFDKWASVYNFDSKLDSNNNFTFINLKWFSKSKYDDLWINIELKNKIIKWWIVSTSSSYDWDSDEYIKSDNIKADINWTTDSNNKLETLNIDIKGTNINDNSEFLNSNFKYKTWEFSLNNYLTSKYSKSDFEIKWKWDSINKILTWLDSKIVIKSKDYYSEDEFYEIFNSNIKLENKIISWNTIINSSEWKIASISHNWKYEKNFFEINNKFNIEQNPINPYSEEKVSWNFNISTDLRNNSQNAKIFLDVNLDSKQVIKFEVENIAKRTYKDVKINAPTNTIDYTEVFPEYNY